MKCVTGREDQHAIAGVKRSKSILKDLPSSISMRDVCVVACTDNSPENQPTLG